MDVEGTSADIAWMGITSHYDLDIVSEVYSSFMLNIQSVKEKDLIVDAIETAGFLVQDGHYGNTKARKLIEVLEDHWWGFERGERI